MTDEYRLARAADEAGEHALATPAEVAAFQDAFLRLLEHRTAIYTMGDSTSVPTHVAADLLLSVCFVLGIDPEDRAIPEHLLRVDLEEEYRRRLADIERQLKAAERLWRDVVATHPLIPNIALRDTLKEIGEFFKHYDYRSMAHDIPCSIDYPLCHPVPESLQGVDYIAEYLRRLMIEAEFLAQFEIAACERVLACASPDYIELLVNLYEPVAVNAIGLALVGEDVRGLAIGDEVRERIAERLRPLGKATRERLLREAAAAVCEARGVRDASAREYLRALVPELLPRVAVGLAYGSLRGVWVG
jgi:hypothetical protein